MKLFNISPEHVKDIQSAVKYCEEIKTKEDLKMKELHIIKEEEDKEVIQNKQKFQKLDDLKTKVMNSNKNVRNVIDNLNITDLIDNIHIQYSELLLKELQDGKDIKKLLENTVKKQMLLE